MARIEAYWHIGKRIVEEDASEMSSERKNRELNINKFCRRNIFDLICQLPLLILKCIWNNKQKGLFN